jgi:plastocyanin
VPSRRNLALFALIIAIVGAGASTYLGFSATTLLSGPRTTPEQVVVIIVPGSAVNPKLGFTPAIITVVIGVNNTVIWKNEDSDSHTAHSNIPEFNSGFIPPGGSFEHSFERAGSYPYHCDPHPWMTGLVVVKALNGREALQPEWPFQTMPQFPRLENLLVLIVL